MKKSEKPAFSQKLDYEALTYEDIRIHFDVYSSVEIGKTRNPNGTYHRETKLVCSYKTNIGEIPENEYDDIALKVIDKNNERWIFDRVYAHVKTFPFLKTEQEQFHYAIEVTVSKAYEAWIEKGDFLLTSEKEPGQIDIFQFIPDDENKKSNDVEDDINI